MFAVRGVDDKRLSSIWQVASIGSLTEPKTRYYLIKFGLNDVENVLYLNEVKSSVNIMLNLAFLM
jgi:hypothetical protein